MLGFVFACIPGALIVGWVLLPIAFVLSLVALFLAGAKWPAITGLIIAITGTIVGVVVFFVVVSDAFDDAFDEALSDPDVGVTIDAAHQTVDYEGKPALVVDFTFTNRGDEDVSFAFAADVAAFQNGVELEEAVLDESDAGDQLKDVKPGGTIVVSEAFVLVDASEVGVEVTQAFSLNDKRIASKTFPIKATEDQDFGEAHSDYDVTIDRTRQTEDYEGKPALLVQLTFTNNSDADESFVFALSVKAFQKGIELEDAFLRDSESSNLMKDIKPGKSITVQEAFVLDGRSDVVVEVTEAISADDTVLTTKKIRIK